MPKMQQMNFVRYKEQVHKVETFTHINMLIYGFFLLYWVIFEAYNYLWKGIKWKQIKGECIDYIQRSLGCLQMVL
jgi:hypothetical protein